MNLLLCEPEEVDSGGKALVSGSRAEHLRKVLKSRPGDMVSAGIIGRGRGSGEILGLKPGHAEIRITLDSPPDQLYPVTLVLGMVRPIQVKRILKTAASFGIEGIGFVPTELGEASYRDANIWSEYRRHLVEGAAQGGVCTLPQVRRYRSLQECLGEPAAGRRKIVFDLPQKMSTETPLAQQEPVLLLIGSERGWTDKERERISSAGFELRTLGRRILTTETACTAAVALILKEQGLFSAP